MFKFSVAGGWSKRSFWSREAWTNADTNLPGSLNGFVYLGTLPGLPDNRVRFVGGVWLRATFAPNREKEIGQGRVVVSSPSADLLNTRVGNATQWANGKACSGRGRQGIGKKVVSRAGGWLLRTWAGMSARVSAIFRKGGDEN